MQLIWCSWNTSNWTSDFWAIRSTMFPSLCIIFKKVDRIWYICHAMLTNHMATTFIAKFSNLNTNMLLSCHYYYLWCRTAVWANFIRKPPPNCIGANRQYTNRCAENKTRQKQNIWQAQVTSFEDELSHPLWRWSVYDKQKKSYDMNGTVYM